MATIRAQILSGETPPSPGYRISQLLQYPIMYMPTQHNGVAGNVLITASIAAILQWLVHLLPSQDFLFVVGSPRILLDVPQ